MAGAGQRFVDAGYETPKPLLPVGGIPMCVRAARSLPNCEHWIFICRDRHIADSKIDVTLKKHFPGADIVGLGHLTEGQASTCLLARELLEPDDVLTIGACDNGMTYDGTLSEDIFRAREADALIWTFRNNPTVLQDPSMYGWVRIDAGGNVEKVSCKVPISEKPMDDHAVIGSFTFRRADIFLDSVDAMISQDRRVNGEFYVDVAIDVAVGLGYRVRVLEVEHYIGWGTPRDLEIYNYWRGYFSSTGLE